MNGVDVFDVTSDKIGMVQVPLHNLGKLQVLTEAVGFIPYTFPLKVSKHHQAIADP